MEELGGNTHVANRGARMKSNHPTYVVMVKEAIQALRERNGSSRQKITKYIISNHLVSPDLTKVNYHVSSALKKAVADGTIIQTKGKGASGSFKLAKAEKDAMLKKAKEADKEKPKAAAVAKKKVPAKVKKSQPVTGKTPAKVTKKVAAVAAKRRLSSANAITAVLSTPRHPKQASKKGSPRAPNTTFTLSLSEASSQDELPSLEIDEKQIKKKKVVPTTKTKPGAANAAKKSNEGSSAAGKPKGKSAPARKSPKANPDLAKIIRPKKAVATNKKSPAAKKTTKAKSQTSTKKPTAAPRNKTKAT